MRLLPEGQDAANAIMAKVTEKLKAEGFYIADDYINILGGESMGIDTRSLRSGRMSRLRVYRRQLVYRRRMAYRRERSEGCTGISPVSVALVGGA